MTALKHVLATIVLGSALLGCGGSPGDAGRASNREALAKAEAFIDSFYSFDPSVLDALLDHAKSSKPSILYYQGWAQGGNYKIMDRKPCMPSGENVFACPVTVDDDLINALGFTFDVTDTFTLTFSDGEIVSVETSSNDPPEFDAALAWIRAHRPELIEVPCQGFFEGGPTPGACVQAVVEGFKEFASVEGVEKKGQGSAAT